MNKGELVSAIAAEAGLTKNDAKKHWTQLLMPLQKL
ncbi:nucleoid DNA-binding protein [Microbacter margulisiae]|uniref:Nucleoid DNA-binding protein n=1 Tax=Microbacter margulisiae TaxID=1350067 RepID=A0A7W5DT39_9PORP|nr:nucleoid DNA-binding protein [Microbacter margulisiae]